MIDAIRRFCRTLSQPREERDYRDRVTQRARLTDREIADRFFPGHPNPEIPMAVARVVRVQLGIESLAPDDNLADAFPDIPFEELVYDVLDELGFRVESVDFDKLDGTAANLVAALNKTSRER